MDAHAVRLSGIFALLDLSEVVEVVRLEAALAVCDCPCAPLRSPAATSDLRAFARLERGAPGPRAAR